MGKVDGGRGTGLLVRECSFGRLLSSIGRLSLLGGAVDLGKCYLFTPTRIGVKVDLFESSLCTLLRQGRFHGVHFRGLLSALRVVDKTSVHTNVSK